MLRDKLLGLQESVGGQDGGQVGEYRRAGRQGWWDYRTVLGDIGSYIGEQEDKGASWDYRTVLGDIWGLWRARRQGGLQDSTRGEGRGNHGARGNRTTGVFCIGEKYGD
jgi:hypothetical protein